MGLHLGQLELRKLCTVTEGAAMRVSVHVPSLSPMVPPFKPEQRG